MAYMCPADRHLISFHQTHRVKKKLEISTERLHSHPLTLRHSHPSCAHAQVVWQEVFGFLDGIKGATISAADPSSLADLMAKWQEYELTRSQSDVLVFAKNMVEDVALSKHLERAVESQHGFIRDSSGIWCRFHAMIVDGELKVDHKCAELLAKAVNGFLDRFDADGGSAPQYAGAVYAQVAAALMCANVSGMSTAALVPICRRVGLACCKFWVGREGEVRQLLPKYVAHVTHLSIRMLLCSVACDCCAGETWCLATQSTRESVCQHVGAYDTDSTCCFVSTR